MLRFCVFLLFAPLFAAWEYWPTQEIQRDLTPTIRFEWETQGRYRMGEGEFYYAHSQYLLTQSVGDGWFIGGGLREVWTRNGNWNIENRPLFEFAKLFKHRRFDFSIRERVQCNLTHNHFVLRNRFLFAFPLTERWKLILLDEFFLRNASLYEENRLEWFLQFRPKKRAVVGVGYMLKTTDYRMDQAIKSFLEVRF